MLGGAKIGKLTKRLAGLRKRLQPCTAVEREFRLKGIAEGTYNTKHAEAARLYYTTILLYYDTTTYTHTHLLSFKLGHAHERRCGPNH